MQDNSILLFENKLRKNIFLISRLILFIFSLAFIAMIIIDWRINGDVFFSLCCTAISGISALLSLQKTKFEYRSPIVLQVNYYTGKSYDYRDLQSFRNYTITIILLLGSIFLFNRVIEPKVYEIKVSPAEGIVGQTEYMISATTDNRVDKLYFYLGNKKISEIDDYTVIEKGRFFECHLDAVNMPGKYELYAYVVVNNSIRKYAEPVCGITVADDIEAEPADNMGINPTDNTGTNPADKLEADPTDGNVTSPSSQESSPQPSSPQQPQWGAWSDWSTQRRESNGITEVESKTQYRFCTKETTTSNLPQIAGWKFSHEETMPVEYNWSLWSTNPVSESNTVQVETKMQYSYRDITVTESWGNWSDWTTTAYTQSSTREVETKTQYRQYQVQIRLTSGTWPSSNGSNYVETGSRTQYTEWVDEKYPEHFTSIVENGITTGLWHPHETRTVYRYQDKTISTSTGGWSSWSDNYTAPSDTCEVREQTLYRSKESYTISTYHFYRWSNWSGWEDGSGEYLYNYYDDSEVDVQEQTLYRYRTKS